jgi:hypothetical protein
MPVATGLFMSFHVTHASHIKMRKSGMERKVAWAGDKKKKSPKAIKGSKKRMWHISSPNREMS